MRTRYEDLQAIFKVNEDGSEQLKLKLRLKVEKAPARQRVEERRFQAKGKASAKSWDKEFGR